MGLEKVHHQAADLLDHTADANTGISHHAADLRALLDEYGHRLLARCQTHKNVLELVAKIHHMMAAQFRRFASLHDLWIESAQFLGVASYRDRMIV